MSVRIPSLVGGLPTSVDFAPSVIFAIAYALLVPVMLYRLVRTKSRVYTLLINTTIFATERIVIYALRASQAHFDKQPSRNLIIYQQISFALGFLAFASDAVNLKRAVLVNTTLPDPTSQQKDDPRSRFWFRRYSDFYGLVYLASTVPGIIAGTKYSRATTNQALADQVFTLRNISAALAILLLLIFLLLTAIARNRIPRVDTKPLDFILTLIALAVIIPIYRLAVMQHTTPYLAPTPESFEYPPGSFTSPRDKALFYIFHALPEYIASVLLLTCNVRKLCNTGPFGDWRGSDRSGIPALLKDGMPAGQSAEANRSPESG